MERNEDRRRKSAELIADLERLSDKSVNLRKQIERIENQQQGMFCSRRPDGELRQGGSVHRAANG